MKKINLIVLCVSICGALIAQVFPQKNIVKYKSNNVNNKVTFTEPDASLVLNSNEKEITQKPTDHHSINLTLNGRNSNSRTILWSEDFSGGFPALWSTSSSNTTGGSATCPWEWTIDGTFGYYNGNQGSSGTNEITSTTATNGFLICDTDSANHYSYGQPSGSTYEYIESMFTTNAIDLSSNAAVSLEFEHLFRYNNLGAASFTPPSIYISTDSINWTSFLVNNSVPNNTLSLNPESFSINISNIAGNQPQVYLRFGWVARCYYWMIDDIKITVPPENDIQNLSSWIFGENSNGAEYGRTPIAQVEQNYYVGASVYNYGSTAQSNVVVNGDFNGPTSFTTTASIASIPIDSAERVESLEPMNFAIGVYNGVITATSAGDTTGSGNFGDNLYLRNFEITNDVYSLDGIGNNPSSTESLSSIGSNSFTGAEDGLICATMYPFFANDTINSVTALITTNTIAGAEVILYIIDSLSFTSGSLNNAIFISNVYTVTPQDVANGFIEIPVGTQNDSLVESLAITPGNYYAALELFSYSTYDIRIIDDQTVGQPAWSSAIYIPQDQAYNNGNAFAIRVNLGDNTYNNVGITENINTFSIYPNPTNGIINISSNGNELSELTVKDINGKIVLVINFQSLISINMDNYSKGVYIVDVKNNQGITSKKISVQ